MPMNSSESPVNRLTSSFADKVTNTCVKEASVRSGLGEMAAALARSNPHLPSDTAHGVEVERKWQRAITGSGSPMYFAHKKQPNGTELRIFQRQHNIK